MAWGWADEFRGGLLTVLSLAGIYLYLALSSGGRLRGPWFAVFSLPGILFFLLGLLERLAVSRHAPAP